MFLLLKINYFNYFLKYNYKTVNVFYNNYTYNFFFLLKLFNFFKKSNSILKKLNKNLLFNFFFHNILHSYAILNKNYINLNKYFFFFQNNSVQSVFNNNSLKLVDMKKKFSINLYEFKNNFNIILNVKKKKLKTVFKHFKQFYLYFLKFNIFFYEYNILKILLKLKYIYNYSDFFFFVKKKYIFLNRSFYNINSVTVFKQNDVLEFIFNKLFISYLEKCYYVYNKFKFKKKSQNTKKLSTYYYFFDIFTKTIYFENSFKANSVILFSNKINLLNLSNNYSLIFNYYLIQLYRWKY